MTAFTESVVEQVARPWLESIGRTVHNGAGREWFKPWRTIAGDTLAGAHRPGLQEACK